LRGKKKKRLRHKITHAAFFFFKRAGRLRRLERYLVREVFGTNSNAQPSVKVTSINTGMLLMTPELLRDLPICGATDLPTKQQTLWPLVRK
jgi:hypothetical protein